MKENFFKIVKIILMILGGIFLMQLLIVIGIAIGINSLINFDFDIKPTKQNRNNLKQIQPIINYVEKIKDETGKYPTTLDNANLKIKSNVYFEYKTEDVNNCYIIKFQNKKGNSKKEYQHCSTNSNGINSRTESYSEISN